MDLFRSWLYGRDKPERFSPNVQRSNEISNSVSYEASTDRTAIGNESLSRNGGRPMNTTDQETSTFEKLVLRVVPLEPGDCLGCKLVGTSVMIASGVIVLTSAMAGRKRNPSLTGRKLTTYYAVCGSLFIGFQSAAVCRFFDLGPFGYLARLETKYNNSR